MDSESIIEYYQNPLTQEGQALIGMDDVSMIRQWDKVRLATMTCDDSRTGQLEVIIPHGHEEPVFDRNAKVSKRPEPEPC